jgi:hypothetical protein
MKIEKVFENSGDTLALFEGGDTLPIICWAVIKQRQVVRGDVEMVKSVVGMVPDGADVVSVKQAGNFLRYEKTSGNR